MSLAYTKQGRLREVKILKERIKPLHEASQVLGAVVILRGLGKCMMMSLY